MNDELGRQRFIVLLCRSIWDGTRRDAGTDLATMTKEVHLPFAPWAGLQLSLAGEMPRSVARVRWDLDDERFACYLDDEFVDLVGIDAFAFDELIADGIDHGWKHVGTIHT